MKYHLTPVSSNPKTGPIPVSTSSAATCPPTCPFNHRNSGGCYAEQGKLAIHWRHVTAGTRGDELADFLSKIKRLPAGQLWRHNQAGDLPGEGATIDGRALSRLVAANRGKRGFTYTHKHTTAKNLDKIRRANAGGFTINLSADTLAHADALKASGAGPVVVVLPADQKTNTTTPDGHRVVICPATVRSDVSCATCGLCAIGNRSVIVGFPAHGPGQKKASAVASA